MRFVTSGYELAHKAVLLVPSGLERMSLTLIWKTGGPFKTHSADYELVRSFENLTV